MTTTGPIDLDRLTLDDVRAGALSGRPVTVLGLARSGLALARFLADAGAAVTVYDGRPADELAEAIAALGGRPVILALGPAIDPATTWRAADLVATSPSITPDFPTTEPRLRAALRALVDARAGGDATVPALVSEADLFLRLCPAPTVGVTGTKGKTTTSALTAAILSADPNAPGRAGREHRDPARRAAARADARSSGGRSSCPSCSCRRCRAARPWRSTRTSPRTTSTGTGRWRAYRRVKRRLAELVDPAGALVLNDEDPVVSAYAGPAGVATIRYRRDAPLAGGLGVVDGWIVADDVPRLVLAGGGRAAAGPGGRIMPADELAIPGAHNVSNALAAIAVALAFGVDVAGIRRAAAAFTGVEHRIEPVALVDGVRFVNDSMGTQPDAVIAALRAFGPPVVLIAGGRDKGIDLTDLAPVVAERAAAAVLIGESGPALERSFRDAGLARTERAASLEDAVGRADAIARDILATGRTTGQPPGGQAGPATVLLSPAAASFDMFVDYAARGRAFKAAVAALAATRAGKGDR